MGSMMADNGGRLLGLYDEVEMFLSQINVFHGKNVADSHEKAVFLQLYGGSPWSRKTVSGEANYDIKNTSLTIGGFTQPFVARNLIESPGNSEMGL
uniref:Uncharacterized protein n=1 Tax=Amphimedon queenslandica TaxID=400682 RepID=A0A1X7V3K6_AMPQE